MQALLDMDTALHALTPNDGLKNVLPPVRMYSVEPRRVQEFLPCPPGVLSGTPFLSTCHAVNTQSSTTTMCRLGSTLDNYFVIYLT